MCDTYYGHPDDHPWFHAGFIPPHKQPCEDCGATEDVSYKPCPYAYHVNEEVELVWLCDKCSSDRYEQV